MGRGRDLIFLSRHGFRVLGVDRDPMAIARARRRAAGLGLPIRTELADLRTYRLRGSYEVLFSSSALNHLPPSGRARRFAHFQRATVPEGIHAINVFDAKEYARPSPDIDPGGLPFRRGELRSYYRRWSVLEDRELALECRFGGRPHRHFWQVIVAQKPKSGAMTR
ncbi:MAG: methyltransferase domain-containing protein [Euryarchaeota archaeon]|nr:methyltransferase domain-containing protein [Euryarchaeota archaeon]MDE2044941.1 methyltransferase domain-containing protein [Thermoplasmata archaeon]